MTIFDVYRTLKSDTSFYLEYVYALVTLLESLSLGELHNALQEVEGKKPTQRLMLAILYKQGPSVPMLADWFDMRDDTIYRWFRQMETEPLRDAIRDDPPPGRSPKLAEDEWERLAAALRDAPTAVGYDVSVWTTTLTRRYLDEEFDVEYTLRHVRRLLKEAGLSVQTPRSQSLMADCEGREEFKDTLEKTD